MRILVLVITGVFLISCAETDKKISVSDQKLEKQTGLSLQEATKNSNTKNKALFRLAFNVLF